MKIFKKNTIPLHHTSSGSLYEIDVYKYGENSPNKKIYIQAALHGNKITGIPTLYKLMRLIENWQLDLEFIIVPIANPMSLDSQILGIQVGYNNIQTNRRDCFNWNRLCDTKRNGIERNWITTILNLAKDADIVIDLHCSFFEAVPHIYCHESLIDEAKKFGIKNILFWKNAGNAFEDFCFKRSQKAFTLELYQSHYALNENINRSIKFLDNYLNNKKIKNKFSIWDIENVESFFTSPDCGVIVWEIEVGKKFKKDQVMYKIYKREKIVQVKAPYNGLFLAKMPIHAPHEGQEIAQIMRD